MIVVIVIPNIQGSGNNSVKIQSRISHAIIHFLSLEIVSFYDFVI